MAQHDRGLLKVTEVERFRMWLEANGQAWRPGKGDYQLLQVQIGKDWPAICVDAKSVVTTPPQLASLIKLFKQGGTVDALKKEAKTEAKPSALRDELAMLAAESMLPDYMALIRMDQDGGMDSVKRSLKVTAEVCYHFADAMLAARNK